MLIETLNLHQFRNFSTLSLPFSPGHNLIVGPNGAGKTALLEAIYTAIIGKSFRAPRLNPLIQHTASQFDIHLKLHHPLKAIGFSKKKQQSRTERYCLGNPHITRAEIVQALPLQIIAPEKLSLLLTSAEARRRLLDWLMFHVEPKYLQIWQQYHRCLRQRNTILQNPSTERVSLDVWDDRLSEYGEKLSQYRGIWAENWLKNTFRPLVATWFPGITVSLQYWRGWKQEIQLPQALRGARSHDLHTGYTSIGPHRSDFKFEVEKNRANLFLSRGQQKLFITAAILSMLALVQQQKRQKTLLLWDDILSEFDSLNLELALTYAHEHLTAQMVFSAIDPSPIQNVSQRRWGESVAVFHVEPTK